MLLPTSLIGSYTQPDWMIGKVESNRVVMAGGAAIVRADVA